MPELPEVETTRNGIAVYAVGKRINTVIVRNRQLRWPVPARLRKVMSGALIQKIDRRGKYLLFYIETGCMILHLGMSGSLRMVEADTPAKKHDHVDIVLETGRTLRLHDPRRFGSIHWTTKAPLQHKLLKHLGPEPLAADFNVDYLFAKSRQRTRVIKTFIMDSHIVVGVGNIYANEALFLAGIDPRQEAGSVSKKRYAALVTAIKSVLKSAIKKGGTTLRDFVNGEGKPGYFKNELNVYDRAGESCSRCATKIKGLRIGQRATCYCPRCQR